MPHSNLFERERFVNLIKYSNFILEQAKVYLFSASRTMALVWMVFFFVWAAVHAEMAKPHTPSELHLIQVNAEITKRKDKLLNAEKKIGQKKQIEEKKHRKTSADMQRARIKLLDDTLIVSANGSHSLRGKDIWIAAFPRTMSSTTQTVFESAQPDTFSLFEPCLEKTDASLYNTTWSGRDPTSVSGLIQCVQDMFDCDFSKIINFRDPTLMWSDVESDGVNAHLNFTSRCQSSSGSVVKTIRIVDLNDIILPVLNARPNMHAVHIVRDPRAMSKKGF